MIGDDKMQLKKFRKLNYRNNLIIVIFILLIIVLASVYLYKTYAIFTSNKQFNVINGTVGDPGDIYFAYYVDGKITRSMPTQNTGYTLNEEKSECTNGVVAKWDNASWQFIGNYSNYNATDYTRTRCNLYFEKTSKIVSTSIGDIEVNTYTPDFSKSACDDDTCESHEKGIYETLDDDGTSYYYRGSVENNYVKFAGFYWRIIRINGNGSIRAIYDGTVAHDNGLASTDRVYEQTVFNNSDADNMYVGYEYASGQVHGNGTMSGGAYSVIRMKINEFTNTKLAEYADYMDISSGFCNDRATLNEDTEVGTGTTISYDRGYMRIGLSHPSLKCDLQDYFIGTGVGLITADEVMLAGFSGGFISGNFNYSKSSVNSYLCIGSGFWTMTPLGYYTPFKTGSHKGAMIYFVSKRGGDYFANYQFGLRPVINLKNTLKFTGDGTKNNPYIPNLN